MVSNKTLNKVWVIILIIIGILVICYYFFGFEIIGEIKNIPSNIANGIKKEVTLNDDYCEENIIPDKIIVAETPNYPTGEITVYNLRSDWKDGTKIEYDNIGITPLCKKGETEGENVNNFYCYGFLYNKNAVDENGNVGEKLSYKINLVLSEDSKFIEQLKTFYGGKGDNLVSFDVIDSTCYQT